MRGDSFVAGEGRVVVVPKFHSWDKCTLLLTNINSDWMSNTSSGLCSIYFIMPVLCFVFLGVTSLYMCAFNYLISILTGILVGTPLLQQDY